MSRAASFLVLGPLVPFLSEVPLLHRQRGDRLIAGMGCQFGDAAEEVKSYPLGPDTDDNALRLRVTSNQLTFFFCDRYNLSWFRHAHSMADARRAKPVGQRPMSCVRSMQAAELFLLLSFLLNVPRP